MFLLEARQCRIHQGEGVTLETVSPGVNSCLVSLHNSCRSLALYVTEPLRGPSPAHLDEASRGGPPVPTGVEIAEFDGQKGFDTRTDQSVRRANTNAPRWTDPAQQMRQNEPFLQHVKGSYPLLEERR